LEVYLISQLFKIFKSIITVSKKLKEKSPKKDPSKTIHSRENVLIYLLRNWAKKTQIDRFSRLEDKLPFGFAELDVCTVSIDSL
jgi:hypothetical protein